MQEPNPSPNATVVEGEAHNGKRCCVIDNTGRVPRADLEALLAGLIEERRFGLNMLSATGSATIRLDQPQFSHVQFGDDLYRLLLFPYEARIESF